MGQVLLVGLDKGSVVGVRVGLNKESRIGLGEGFRGEFVVVLNEVSMTVRISGATCGWRVKLLLGLIWDRPLNQS